MFSLLYTEGVNIYDTIIIIIFSCFFFFFFFLFFFAHLYVYLACVIFVLFLLVVVVDGCGLWLWHSLDFSLNRLTIIERYWITVFDIRICVILHRLSSFNGILRNVFQNISLMTVQLHVWTQVEFITYLFSDMDNWVSVASFWVVPGWIPVTMLFHV